MIRKILLLIAACLLSFTIQAGSQASQIILKQLIENAHGGVELHTIDGQTSYSGYVGTGYQYYFYKQKAYIKPELDIKWGEYKYQSGYHVETASIAIPVTIGYHLFQQKDIIGMTVFGGGRYEQIVHSANNNYAYGINNAQAGLTAGTSISFFNKFSINASYYYGLTTLYKDGSGRVSSFNFSFNF